MNKQEGKNHVTSKFSDSDDERNMKHFYLVESLEF